MSDAANPASFEGPIQRESIAELVVRRILDMVKAGVLKAGDALPPERDLAASLNVSRASVREALRGLAVLGVVKTRQGGGAYISDLGPESLLSPLQFYFSLHEVNIRELYDARGLIESDVARRAALNIDPAGLDRLEAILADQRATIHDPNAFRISDFEFHQTIWRGARNAILKSIGEGLNFLGLEIRERAWEQPGVLEQSLLDHRRLLDALKSRDPDAAAAAAEQHMRNVFQSTVMQVKKGTT